MQILVTGGTGTLGRDVVEMLRRRGHTVRVLSRRAASGDGVVRGDLATGVGLAEAVAEVDTIVNAASATADP
ncbi:MAG TPA: NAD-dependent epimerase/dehydratase family protein, partial [Longimicrobium sp.]